MGSNRNATEIYSVFGQIEAVAAQKLIDEGIAKKIEAKDIPASARFNEQGRAAQFAIVIARKHVARFEELIANLRA